MPLGISIPVCMHEHDSQKLIMERSNKFKRLNGFNSYLHSHQFLRIVP